MKPKDFTRPLPLRAECPASLARLYTDLTPTAAALLRGAWDHGPLCLGEEALLCALTVSRSLPFPIRADMQESPDSQTPSMYGVDYVNVTSMS